MIGEFISSWNLFYATYLAGWLAGILLSVGGVLLVARGQFFLGAAVAQAAMLGVSASLLLTEHTGLQILLAVTFGIAACWLAAVRANEGGEARTAWIFLAASSLAVLLVSRNPHGMEEVQRVMASSLIGAAPLQVITLGIAAALCVLGIVLFWRPYLLFVTDPQMARASGLPTGLIALTAYGLLGGATGVSLQTTGMLYTFGHLVLPTMIARSHCHTLHGLFVASALWGVAANATGFILANHYDFPPGQTAVAILCLTEVVGLIWASFPTKALPGKIANPA